MKFYNIHFSPTGGTRKVANLLTSKLTQEACEIDLTDPTLPFETISLDKEDIALLAVPSYSGRVPAPALQRIAALKGNGAKAILVCVYGNRAFEDTLIELLDTTKEAGFKTIAAVAAIAEHSIAHRYAAGRPDEQDQIQLTSFADQILQKVAKGEETEPQIPGNRPYRKVNANGPIPKPTKACSNCGLCTAKCPVSAIDKTNVKQVNEQLCISCMRCVAICPHKARKISRVMACAINTMLKKVCSTRKENELFL